MVKIRLARVGAKKQPKYRIVVAESTYKRTGRNIETIGYYDPTVNPYLVKINKERYLYWVSVGGQPTVTVRNLFKKLAK